MSAQTPDTPVVPEVDVAGDEPCMCGTDFTCLAGDHDRAVADSAGERVVRTLRHVAEKMLHQTEVPGEDLRSTVDGWAGALHGAATLLADEHDEIATLRERVRVVEGERDAWKTTASDTRKWALAEIDKADARAEAAEAEVSNLEADYDRRGERLWRLAGKAGHVPSESDNDATAELVITDALAAHRELRAEVEAACVKAEMLTQDAIGVRSQHWRGPDYADGLDCGIEMTAALVREALADGGERP